MYAFLAMNVLIGRGDRIRTCDFLLPKQAPYHWATPRAELVYQKTPFPNRAFYSIVYSRNTQ